ncbi:MAG: hypothetical protein ABJH82_01420 [Polaribacter sp.]|uniref:hypothetical protein n=1 Tax=Polaribacter sp. TaxID=1920175 RepID=UPI00329780F9
MKACPQCKSVSRYRIKRRSIQKIIPGTKAYVCDRCNFQYTWIPWVDQSLRI